MRQAESSYIQQHVSALTAAVLLLLLSGVTTELEAGMTIHGQC